MSKHRVAVLKVVTNQSSVTAAAAEHGLSRGHLHRLLRRYRQGGLEALEPRSRQPHSNPRRTPEAVRDRIVALRTELTAQGLDAGPVTIAWHLERDGLHAPSTSTIRRILHAAGLVMPQPHKRPRSASRRFEADAPNEVWQSDMTHWRLADGTEVEICSWLDDHSRYLLGCTAFGRVDGDDVVTTFCAAGEEYGWPAATLTDNGAIYTSRFTRGHNAFEHLLAYLGIRQRNGAPEPSPDAGQDRALRADAQALARATARRAEPGRAAGPTRCLPDGLRRGATPPGDRPSHPRRSLRGDAQGPARGSSRPGSSPPALRHRRQGRRHDPASGRPPASPGDRGCPSRSSCPGHRRRAGGHRRGTRDRGGPLIPPHRARAPVLAQPTTKPRPMAGASSDRVTSVLVHRLSPMSRLMCHTCRDSRQWLRR